MAEKLSEQGVAWEYEPRSGVIEYQPPPRKYTPDFVINGKLIVEVKGRFTSADRVKHVLIKAQHPELDIRFVFQRDNLISPVSKKRYSDWCRANGFEFAFNEVPIEWLT